MKNTKKIITLALAAAMLSATGITAYADTTNVSYNVDPSYTVVIPAAVTLGDTDVTADIEASDVLLETGKQVVVALTAASNTESGSTFNAKNGDSAVTYTITADKAVSVGDTVAKFTANGSQTLTFSAAVKSDATTVAGAHTETLTFTIGVEAAAATTAYTYTSGQTVYFSQIAAGDTLEAGAIIRQDGGQMWSYEVFVDGTSQGEYLDDWAAEYGDPAYTTTGSVKVSKIENGQLYLESYTPTT